MDLTKRQQEIFDFIKSYSGKHGYPPTVRDIGKAVGLASSSTVHAHLANLEKAGLLRRDPTKPRAIELLDRAIGGVKDTVEQGVRSIVGGGGLPLLGQVAAGSPILAEENIEEYVSVPPHAGGDRADDGQPRTRDERPDVLDRALDRRADPALEQLERAGLGRVAAQEPELLEVG